MFLLAIFLILFSSRSYAANLNLNAEVGGPRASFSGYSSPNATNSAYIDTFQLSSTKSDDQGNFSFIKIGLYKNAVETCFIQTDQKYYGISDSCYGFAAITTDQEFKNIFLPPSIGLEKETINPGADAVVRGYTMPGSVVEIKQKGGKSIKLTSTNEGFYTHTYERLEKGTYHFSSTATFNGINSLVPKNEAVLNVGTIVGGTQEIESESSMILFSVIIIILILLLPLAALYLTKTEQGKFVVRRVRYSNFVQKLLKQLHLS